MTRAVEFFASSAVGGSSIGLGGYLARIGATWVLNETTNAAPLLPLAALVIPVILVALGVVAAFERRRAVIAAGLGAGGLLGVVLAAVVAREPILLLIGAHP